MVYNSIERARKLERDYFLVIKQLKENPNDLELNRKADHLGHLVSTIKPGLK